MLAWRICDNAELNGQEGARASARWHAAPRAMIYLSLSPEGALLEMLAHLETEKAPEASQLIEVSVPADAITAQLPTGLPEGWRIDESLTRRIGNEWFDAGRHLALIVPSALMPPARNLLLNASHPAIRDCTVARITPFTLDERLARG